MIWGIFGFRKKILSIDGNWCVKFFFSLECVFRCSCVFIRNCCFWGLLLFFVFIGFVDVWFWVGLEDVGGYSDYYG